LTRALPTWGITVGFFNLLRNRYSVVVKINYSQLPAFTGQIFIRFIGTHAEYDRITDIANL
jgi:mRNA-degrading endonuclease HigB of HigAB toxin-antitoxin module